MKSMLNKEKANIIVDTANNFQKEQLMNHPPGTPMSREELQKLSFGELESYFRAAYVAAFHRDLGMNSNALFMDAVNFKQNAETPTYVPCRRTD